MTKIILFMISYYDAEIYLTNFADCPKQTKYNSLANKNLSNMPFDSLSEIVFSVLSEGIVTMDVLFAQKPFLIEACAGKCEFTVNVYNLNMEDDETALIKKMATAEGLFVREFA